MTKTKIEQWYQNVIKLNLEKNLWKHILHSNGLISCKNMLCISPNVFLIFNSFLFLQVYSAQSLPGQRGMEGSSKSGSSTYSRWKSKICFATWLMSRQITTLLWKSWWKLKHIHPNRTAKEISVWQMLSG